MSQSVLLSHPRGLYARNRFRFTVGCRWEGPLSFFWFTLSVDLPGTWLPFIPRNFRGGRITKNGGTGGSFGGSVCVNLCDVSQNVSFQRASSFATGIVLQRYAITALRRLTKGGQSPHMWRQWFYFSRMFGIVFLPAQSGRASPADSRSSWQRNSWPNGRRLMENRHWTLILLFSFPLLTGTGIDKQNTQKDTERIRQVSQASYQTHLSPSLSSFLSHPQSSTPFPPALPLSRSLTHSWKSLGPTFMTPASTG